MTDGSMSVDRRTLKRVTRGLAGARSCAAWPRPAVPTTASSSQEEAIKAQWAQVENQLQRRNDLIPNLVETHQGVRAAGTRRVPGHRRLARQAGRRADARAEDAGGQRAVVRAGAAAGRGRELSGRCKSNATFARLMDELAGTENRIAVERMRYNERVQEYNTSRRQFPANITAGIFGFKDYPLFEAPEAAKVAPKVDFSRPPTKQHRSGVRPAGPAGFSSGNRSRPLSPAVPTLTPPPPSKLVPVDDVVLAAQGDTAAFERVYQAHMPRILNLARRMAGPDAADELTQDVFVRAWQKLGTVSRRVVVRDLAAPAGRERDHRAVPDARHGARAVPGGQRGGARAAAGPRAGPSTWTSAWTSGGDRSGCRRAPARCSCCTTSRATGTKRSARCSASRSGTSKSQLHRARHDAARAAISRRSSRKTTRTIEDGHEHALDRTLVGVSRRRCHAAETRSARRTSRSARSGATCCRNCIS